MVLPNDFILQGKLRKWSRYVINAVAIIAVSVLVGWQFNIEVLKRFSASIVAMNPASAVSFLLVAASFVLIQSGKPKNIFPGKVLAIIISFIGLLKLFSILFDIDIPIDSTLYADKLYPEIIANIPNRMAPNTALAFVFTGLALFLMPNPRVSARNIQVIGLIIGLISLLSLLGYVYQVKSFYGVFSYIAMALHTALCFLLVSIAILFIRPDAGLMRDVTSRLGGSTAARILLPAAIIIPSLLGLLRLWGQWAGIYDVEFGAVIYALLTILLFFAIIWYNTYTLNRRDLANKEAEAALLHSEEENRAIFDNGPDAVVVVDAKGNIVKWNKQATALFGWAAEEVIGKNLTHTIIPQQFGKAHTDGMRRHLNGEPGNLVGTAIDLFALRKDRTEVDVSLRISPFTLNDKKFFIGFIRDITERKRLETKLQNFNDELASQVEEKTAELTDIFERITDGFIALDKDFTYTYVNSKAGDIIHKDPDSLIGKKVWDVFPDAVGSSTYNSFNRAMSTQQHIINTDYYAPLDLWQENYIYPSPNGLSVFIRDITERKNAETKIVEARDLADKLIDSLPGVFYFYDQHGKFIRWNRQFEIVTGYTSEEISQMHPTQFFAADEQEYITNRIQQVFVLGMNDAEAHFVTKSGEKVLYYFKAVSINYEGGPCLLGTGVDITELRKTTGQLQASEQKYKLLFQSNPLPMWMLALPSYDIVEVNEATLIQYGYTREEFLALDIFHLRPDDDIEKLKQVTNREFRGIHHAGVWQHRKRDGSLIYVDIVTHDIYYEGKPTRLVLANEVTQEYLAKEKLEQAYDATRKLTEYLNNVREEERLHMAREIHDELGQLLTVLKMDVSWLNKKIAPVAGPIKDKLTELLGLIDTIVKKVRHIASELRPSLIDDLGLVAAMEWHLDEFEKRSGVRKEGEFPDKEFQLPDSLKIGLFRILQESLTNVARHSGANKVKVTLKEFDQRLFLTIADNGKGIDESKVEKGKLGLLGMKERTKMMGGEYRIHSAVDGGTTVEVIVPLPLANCLENK